MEMGGGGGGGGGGGVIGHIPYLSTHDQRNN